MTADAPLDEKGLSYRSFAQLVAHDLASPLNQIALFADLAERNADAMDEKTARYVRRMREAAQRAVALLDSLHRIAQSGWEGEATRPVSLDAVVADVLSDLEARLQRQNARVKVGPLPEINARPRQLYQLFANLIDNGLKYAGDKSPSIDIAAERKEGNWIVSVRDNGPGIPTGQREAVFEAFRRLNPGVKDGFGIGLTTCRRIVEAHGGRIGLAEAPGGGTCAWFEVPAS